LEQNISYLEACRGAGITDHSITDWKGTKNKKGSMPSADKLFKVSSYLKISLYWLLTGKDETGLTPEQRNLLWNYDKLDKRDKETVLDLIEAILKKQKKEEETVYSDTQPVALEVEEAELAYLQSEPDDTPVFENDVEYLDWEMIMIPYFGKTAAGEPLDINSLPDEYMPFPRQALKGSPSDYFYLKIQGYSMVDAGINEGDMVVIRRAEEPVNGEIMLVRHENASTLKKIAIKKDKIYLCWEDGTRKRLLVDSRDFEVQGILVWITKRPQK
jgi:SOS-response transcriptional repressor LexA